MLDEVVKQELITYEIDHMLKFWQSIRAFFSSIDRRMLISSGLSSITVGSIILLAGKSFVTESVKYGFEKALEDHKAELYLESKIFEIDYSMMQQERFEVMNGLYVKYLALEEATWKFLGSSPPSYSEIKSGDWRHTKKQLDSIDADFSRSLERSKVYLDNNSYWIFSLRRDELSILCLKYAINCSRIISVLNKKDERAEVWKELNKIYEEDIPYVERDSTRDLFRRYLDPDEKKRNLKK